MSRAPTTFVRVYRAADRIEAHLLRGMLDQHGVPVQLLGDGLVGALGELPLEVAQVEIRVPPGFKALARQLIDEYESAQPNAGGDAAAWVCSACGESCPGEYAICWSCGAEQRC